MSTLNHESAPVRREPVTAESIHVPAELSSLQAPEIERRPREQLDLECELVKSFFAGKAAEWERELSARLGSDVKLELEGAMRCGLYRGPRPSKNPDLSGRPLREADFSLRVGDSVDPQDPAAITAVEAVMGLEWFDNAGQNGWGQPSRLSVFYGYFNVPGIPDPVEMEMCVQRQSETCELSEYWHSLFNPAEIEDQRERRYRAELIGNDEYWGEKHRQNEEAKFRLLYAFDTGRLPNAPACVSANVPEWKRWRTEEPPSAAAPVWAREAWLLAWRGEGAIEA